MKHIQRSSNCFILHYLSQPTGLCDRHKSQVKPACMELAGSAARSTAQGAGRRGYPFQHRPQGRDRTDAALAGRRALQQAQSTRSWDSRHAGCPRGTQQAQLLKSPRFLTLDEIASVSWGSFWKNPLEPLFRSKARTRNAR